MFGINEKDTDLRWLLKTFPWIGTAATLVFGYVLTKGLINQRFDFRNTKYTGPDFVALADRPVDFYIIAAIVGVLFVLGLAYCIARIQKRHVLMKEDTAQ